MTVLYLCCLHVFPSYHLIQYTYHDVPVFKFNYHKCFSIVLKMCAVDLFDEILVVQYYYFGCRVATVLAAIGKLLNYYRFSYYSTSVSSRFLFNFDKVVNS